MAIQSKSRADLVRQLAERLREFSDRDVLFSQALADRLGLGLTDFKSLSLLDQRGAMTAGQLADLTGLTTGAITGMLDRLEKAQLVRRTKDPADRRVVRVESARYGGTDPTAHAEGLLEALDLICAAYPEHQVSMFLDVLKRLGEALAEQTAKLRAEGAAQEPSPSSAPLGGISRGTLRFAGGTSRLTLRADAPADKLYQGRFTGREPEVKLTGGTVTFQYRRFSFLEARRLSAELGLSRAIPWEIEVAGGVSRLRGELDELQLARLELRGGASDVELDLPAPKGHVPLRISGGASQLTLRRPRRSAMRVQITGGASSLTFDDQHLGAAGGQIRLESSGFASASDRYELEIVGGASKITLTEAD